MYRIGMFSKLGRVTIKTLRHYDEVGLLTPAHVDKENGYRYYTTNQLFRLYEIMALRQMGFSIPEITDIIDGCNIFGILEQRKAELISEQQSIADRLFRLENYILKQKEGHSMNYQAVIKDIPRYTVYSSRFVAPNYNALFKIIPALGEKVRKANPGIKCIEPGYCFNVYLDGEYRDTDINVEFCEAVTDKGQDGDGILFKDIPAVKVVSVLHRGAYEKLGVAYVYVMQWVEQNGYRITGHVRESHIDGIWNKDSVDEWLTELQVPIEKK
ncbi:putative transcriptional regulator [Desulfosporosinus orientis DSM 765]|uniref:Putative transcriptional regulator n=1 Tax=Desulfosporosinus orientis (strain ATCC 19365 / DSM 765 / NCIMB 8382 / VKM B-1628 / Singapore I) TaxID=768706 RepID=G7W8P8_DESOD|nr:MerR family transcriptional regulator [Desulfosporosinus orientis]AET67758.1 putative transcriptional regulator [Desulfosporosinus orientis DSM 765]